MGCKNPSRATVGRWRILLVDSHSLVRRGLCALIDKEPDLTICAQAVTPRSGFASIAAAAPDLIITELWAGTGGRFALLREIRSRYPDLPVLVFTGHERPVHAERALRAGASGYVTKWETEETLLRAIRCVLGGETYVSRDIKAALENT